MSARVVEREARITGRQFAASVRDADSAAILRMSQKFRKLQAIFGTPYGGRDENPFDILRRQETAVSERVGDPRYWVDAP